MILTSSVFNEIASAPPLVELPLSFMSEGKKKSFDSLTEVLFNWDHFVWSFLPQERKHNMLLIIVKKKIHTMMYFTKLFTLE